MNGVAIVVFHSESELKSTIRQRVNRRAWTQPQREDNSEGMGSKMLLLRYIFVADAISIISTSKIHAKDGVLFLS
ncbi:hypothetical protein AU082_14965 [Yersinia pestis]|nr:hypothetical protein AU082_14965 [Yersinia pestis]